MARTPKLFAAGTAPVAPVSAYTAPSYVPTTQTSLLRHIRIVNGGPAGSFMIGIGGTGAINRIYNDLPIAGSAIIDHHVYIPIPAGSAIHIGGSPTLQLGYFLSGDEAAG